MTTWRDGEKENCKDVQRAAADAEIMNIKCAKKLNQQNSLHWAD